MRETISDWFFSLGELLAEGESIQENPYDLDDEKREQLRRLLDYDEWETYTELLDRTITLFNERLLQVDTQSVDYHRGVVVGLREAALLVDKILKEEEAQNARREQARESAESGGVVDAEQLFRRSQQRS